jgi:hypothetical protein
MDCTGSPSRRSLIFQFLVPAGSQSKELTRGPPELVQHFHLKGGVHIGARALHILNLRFGCIAYPSGEDRGNFLVQVIFTCLRYT